MLYINESEEPVTAPFLSDSAYAEARASLPFVATDAIIVDESARTIYLAWRQATPAKGWWVIGGGVKNGQSPHSAMVKNFVRETTLQLDESRFKLLAAAVNFTQWTNDEQLSNVHIPFTLSLDDNELRVVKNNLDNKEYQQVKGLKSFTLDKLMQAIQDGTGYPQTVLYYDTIFGTNGFPEALSMWRQVRSQV